METQLHERAPTGAPVGARPEDLSVSVVICAYTERRWPALVQAVQSVARQARRPLETIIVIDHNPALLKLASGLPAGVTVLPNAGGRGLSGARNSGVQMARGVIVAFLDDDASAEPGWLDRLLAGYEQRDVVGTGGSVDPRWEAGSACPWLPPEFYWTIGCSYRGLPTEVAPIRNPIGANMSFRREAIVSAGGFREGVGRLGSTPLGCEETELAVRVATVTGGGRILHMPAARVEHIVDRDRTRWRYFRTRCWSEGRSKAIVTRHVGRRDGLASERSYATRTLPLGFARGVGRALRGDGAGARQALAILAGLAITTAGYLWGRLERLTGGVLDGEL